MHWNQVVFLIALGLGIIFCVAGRFVTRLNLREGVAPFDRHTPVVDVALHPEKYAVAEVLPLVRTLNLFGTLGLAAALIAIASELLRA